MSEEAVKAYQGRAFTITLRSYGGTNYLWCLSTMPEEVVLAFVNNNTPSTPQPGAPVDTTFTFLAIEGGLVKVGFKLLCWSNPEEDVKELLFDVNIIPHDEDDELGGFIRYSENAASYNVSPDAYNGVAASVEKYGYPGCDCWQPITEYGYPGCVKYGYPGCGNNTPFLPHYVYGYPGCNETQTVFKYGYPGCDSNWPPIVFYGYPGCVKYGYFGCDFPAPVTDYGYPGCVKYGYPGCR